MAISMDAYINMQQGIYSSGIRQMSQLYDFTSAQKQARSMVDTYQKNQNTIKKMTSESASFLNQYTSGMNGLNQAAGKLAGGGVSKLLYNREGNVTDDTVKNTVGAVRDMVTSYNDNLKMLNDNANRGQGVMSQMARMVDDPAPASSMKMVGVSVNKDGTLALDEEKLAEALKTEDTNQRKLYEDILGGYNSIASGVQNDARAGLSVAPKNLIGNDLAEMQNIRDEDPIRSFAMSLRGGGAYALNNSAAMGIMMNLLA